MFTIPWIDNEHSFFLSGTKYSDDSFFARALFLHCPSWDIEYDENNVPVEQMTIPMLEAGVHFDVDRFSFSVSYLTGFVPDMSVDVDSILSPQTISLFSSPFVGGSLSASWGDISIKVAGVAGNGIFDIESTEFGDYTVSVLWTALSWRDFGTYCGFVRGDLSAATWFNIMNSTGFSFGGTGSAAIDVYGLWGSFGIGRGKFSLDTLVSCALLVNGGTKIYGETIETVHWRRTKKTMTCELDGSHSLLLFLRPSLNVAVSRVVTLTVSRAIPFFWGRDPPRVLNNPSGDSSGHGADDSVLPWLDPISILLAGIGISVSIDF